MNIMVKLSAIEARLAVLEAAVRQLVEQLQKQKGRKRGN